MGKLKFTLEIETPEHLGVFPEEGETDEDYKDRKKELKQFRERFAKDVRNALKDLLKSHLGESIEEYFLNNYDEISIEGFESLEDYGIKIKIKEIKK